MKDEILSYRDMCDRQGMGHLQRGMYFREPPRHGVILMSQRPNAPYEDELSPDGKTLIYEGHNVRRSKDNPNPKEIDQPRLNSSGQPTENGRFASWVDSMRQENISPAIFRVYEKMKKGIWTDRGLYLLEGYDYPWVDDRSVFKFRLVQADFDPSAQHESTTVDIPLSRQIPSWVKQYVFKRDKGKCVICGATDQLHFDHDFPFAKGGTSILPENVRVLCARHNLAKSANIE